MSPSIDPGARRVAPLRGRTAVLSGAGGTVLTESAGRLLLVAVVSGEPDELVGLAGVPGPPDHGVEPGPSVIYGLIHDPHNDEAHLVVGPNGALPWDSVTDAAVPTARTMLGPGLRILGLPTEPGPPAGGPQRSGTSVPAAFALADVLDAMSAYPNVAPSVGDIVLTASTASPAFTIYTPHVIVPCKKPPSTGAEYRTAEHRTNPELLSWDILETHVGGETALGVLAAFAGSTLIWLGKFSCDLLLDPSSSAIELL